MAKLPQSTPQACNSPLIEAGENGAASEVPLTVEQQLEEVAKRDGQLVATDPRYPDIWIKRDGSVIAVRDMSQNHMCMTIGLWLFNEFRNHENAALSSQNFDGKVSAYESLDVWLYESRAMKITPALTTMLNRLKLEGGMQELEAILMERSQQSLAQVHKEADYYLFGRPAFF